MRDVKTKFVLFLLLFHSGQIFANGSLESDDASIKIVLNDVIAFADDKLTGVTQINEIDKIKEFNFVSVINSGEKIVKDLIKLSAATKFKVSAKVYGDCDLFFLSVTVGTVNDAVQKIEDCKTPLCTKDVFLTRKSVFDLGLKELNAQLIDCRKYLNH